MKKEIIIKHLGYVLFLNGLFMFAAFVISFFLSESSANPLLFSGLICIIFGIFPMIFVEKTTNISLAEGLAIVVFGWLITCIAGILPYIMWGGEFTLANAWFESVSGFTTTGSTILNDVEALPKGLLFWRSATHWIGGIGIILFVLLVLPKSKGARVSIFHAEISGLTKMNFKLNLRDIVRVLAGVYVCLTLLQTLILFFFGMSFFDAVNHSFATIATGGFSTKNLSIAAYDSVAIEITIMFFMVLSGIHFGLIYGTVMLKKENIINSSLVRMFVLVMLCGIILVTIKLYLTDYYPLWDALRYASFQVISVGTTTGFATVDTAAWPVFTQIILMYFTIQCAMSGSTSGGLKFDRIYIFFKSIGKQIKILKHPHGVFIAKIDGRNIDEKLEQQTLVFIILYILIFSISTLLLTAMNVDSLTAFSASIATIGNVGPGFENVSSLGNFSSIPDAGKYILSANMFFGRLEIFNILALIMIKK
jgi:trk system potassium uptake protein